MNNLVKIFNKDLVLKLNLLGFDHRLENING